MRRAARRWGLGLALATCGLPAARAQTAPPVAAPVAAPRPDSVKNPSPTFVADTARHVVVVTTTEPTTVVTRRTGLRIGVAIVVLTLTTLLLYNVRSR